MDAPTFITRIDKFTNRVHRNYPIYG